MMGSVLKTILFIPLLWALSFSGCTLVEKGLQWDRTSTKKMKRKEQKTPKLYCRGPQNQELYSTSKESVQLFKQLQSDPRFKKLTLKDKFISLILIHSLVRPEVVSLNSRFQMISYDLKKNQLDYKDFLNSAHKDNSNASLFSALEKLTKSSASSNSLSQILHLLDGSLPQKIHVEKSFETFLQSQKEQIKNSPPHKKVYTKAQQVLRVGETFPRPSLRGIYRELSRNKRNKLERPPLSHLFGPFKQKKNGREAREVYCNFDLNLYRQGIFLISPWKEETNLNFGLYDRVKDKMYWASFSTRPQKVTPHEKLPGFLSKGKTQTSKFCQIKGSQNSVFISSTKGRDPGQHLYHLLQYHEKITHMSKAELSNTLNFPRHLFLTNPLRLIYESERGEREQLQQFLQMKIPLYHAEKLGGMWLFHKSPKKTPQEQGFILDDRHNSDLKCIK